VCHEDRCVALEREDRQGRFDDVMLLVGDQLPGGSIYRLLAEHGAALFGDEYFADLFKRSTLGRPTVPARVVATVMLLQAYKGLSDREREQDLNRPCQVFCVSDCVPWFLEVFG
jgi:hypothetical protein